MQKNADIIQLPVGKIKLQFYDDNRIIFAEGHGSDFTSFELKQVLNHYGITRGLSEQSLEIMSKGTGEEVLLAHSTVVVRPPHLAKNFATQDMSIGQLRNYEEIAWDEILERNTVEEGDVLAQKISGRRQVLEYPLGHDKTLYEYDETLDDSVGVNAVLDDIGDSIIAGVSGIVHQDSFGKIHIYPIRKVRGLGRQNGSIIHKSSMHVDGDINESAYLNISGSLVVEGIIHPCYVMAGGNIFAMFGAINQSRERGARISSGQSLFAQSVQDFNVWAGRNVIVTESVTNSKIECLDTFVAHSVFNCEIKVGQQAFIHDVKGESKIFLGMEKLNDERYNQKSVLLNKHEMNLREKENQLLQIQGQINKLKQNAERSERRGGGKELLMRNYSKSVGGHLFGFNELFDEYKELSAQLLSLKTEMEYYNRFYYSNNSPLIVISGKLETGTIIETAEYSITIEQNLAKVMIQIDPITKIIIIQPLEDDQIEATAQNIRDYRV